MSQTSEAWEISIFLYRRCTIQQHRSIDHMHSIIADMRKSLGFTIWGALEMLSSRGNRWGGVGWRRSWPWRRRRTLLSQHNREMKRTPEWMASLCVVSECNAASEQLLWMASLNGFVVAGTWRQSHYIHNAWWTRMNGRIGRSDQVQIVNWVRPPLIRLTVNEVCLIRIHVWNTPKYAWEL